jgi:hypothetical protein
MPDALSDGTSEVTSRDVARVVWGLLLIWLGAALLLHWTWGVGLVGAGVILVGAQTYRRLSGLALDGFGLVAGLALLISGLSSLLRVTVGLVPLLCIAAGIVLLVSAWTAHRSHGERTELHAHSPPRW